MCRLVIYCGMAVCVTCVAAWYKHWLWFSFGISVWPISPFPNTCYSCSRQRWHLSNGGYTDCLHTGTWSFPYLPLHNWEQLRYLALHVYGQHQCGSSHVATMHCTHLLCWLLIELFVWLMKPCQCVSTCEHQSLLTFIWNGSTPVGLSTQPW